MKIMFDPPPEYEPVYEFRIPLKLNYEYSMNQLSDKYDKHGKKKSIEDLTFATMWAQGLPREPLDTPAKITIEYNDRLDIDNHGFVAKSIVDGIRKYGLLKDDNKKHLQGLYQEFGESDGVQVTIYKQIHKTQTKPGKKAKGK